MLKHSTAPLNFPRTLRKWVQNLLTTGRAGEILPFGFCGLFRGDSASGNIVVDVELGEMPKPIENAVVGRLQTWCVPRPALPHFSGIDEYTHAYQGKSQTALGSATRAAVSLFDTVATGSIAAAQSSEFFRCSGLCLQPGVEINTDYIDAYILVANFRLAAMSSKMTRYDYYQEDNTAALELKPAFWTQSSMQSVVADYESALVTGALELDVSAGSIPISGIARTGTNAGSSAGNVVPGVSNYTVGAGGNNLQFDIDNSLVSSIVADMSSQKITTTLANIDMARKTNAWAKAVSAMDGDDYSGFNTDEVLMLELMNGFNVPEMLLNRPWLISSKTGVFGMNERHATDAANLDDSVTVGRLTLSQSINVPVQDYGAILFSTFEFMPERIYPRQKDSYLEVTSEAELPQALRDSLNIEPVEIVTNAEIDQLHTTPNATFGYRELNGKWNQEFTLQGGDFRALTPGSGPTAARTAIWQPLYVDPVLSTDHYLCPHPFPQDVFSVPANDAATISVRMDLTISGLTQFGNRLVEDTQSFAETTTEGS